MFDKVEDIPPLYEVVEGLPRKLPTSAVFNLATQLENQNLPDSFSA